MTQGRGTMGIGVIGIGQMGSAMAARLAEAGHEVIGYDIDPAARSRASALQLKVVDSLEAAVRGQAVVISSLPDPAAAAAAWLGEAGIIALADAATLCIELSTIDPDTMRRIGAAADERGLKIIDCPVSGSPKEARQGGLVLLAGGELAVIEDAAPILDLLGAKWLHTGPVGTAKVVKIVNNMMSMGNVLVAAEAFALGTAAGVEPQKLYDVLSQSGGRSHHFTKRFPAALAGDFEPGFKMELGEKDLALAVELGRAFAMPTPSASNTRELYAQALASGFRGRDIVALLAMYTKWAETD